ncbi:MAG TPA: hypothetical protein VNG90_00105 [Candidatus Acidoferrum sp.]|nr:hypothetical protein [Candidatus Acidoferrum sp.]
MNEDAFALDAFDIVVCENCQRVMTSVYRAVIEDFDTLLIGFSDWIWRRDRLDVRTIFGPAIVRLRFENAYVRFAGTHMRLIDKWKVWEDFFLEQGELETSEGKITPSQANRRVKVPVRENKIAQIIRGEQAKVQNCRTIICCQTTLHAKRIAEYFPGSLQLHSRSEDKARELLNLLRQEPESSYTVIVVDMLNEGTLHLPADLLVFLDLTSERSVALHQLGSVLLPDKKPMVILDFVRSRDQVAAPKKLKNQLAEAADEEKRKRGKASVDEETLVINLPADMFEFHQFFHQITEMEDEVEPPIPTRLQPDPLRTPVKITAPHIAGQPIPGAPINPSELAEGYWLHESSVSARFILKGRRTDLMRPFAELLARSSELKVIGSVTPVKHRKRFVVSVLAGDTSEGTTSHIQDLAQFISSLKVEKVKDLEVKSDGLVGREEFLTALLDAVVFLEGDVTQSGELQHPVQSVSQIELNQVQEEIAAELTSVDSTSTVRIFDFGTPATNHTGTGWLCQLTRDPEMNLKTLKQAREILQGFYSVDTQLYCTTASEFGRPNRIIVLLWMTSRHNALSRDYGTMISMLADVNIVKVQEGAYIQRDVDHDFTLLFKSLTEHEKSDPRALNKHLVEAFAQITSKMLQKTLS